MPTHRQFMRMMEDAQIRKRFEKFDLEMNSDYNKDRAHKLKEDLHYVIDEKNQQADLTEIGRSLISPKDPDGFVIPDLASFMLKLIAIPRQVMMRSAREKRLQKTSSRFEASEFTRFLNSCVHMVFTKRISSMSCKGGE